MKPYARAILAMIAIASLAACHKAQARTAVAVIALDMPEPPPRVTIPVELPVPEPAPPAPAPAPEPAAPRSENPRGRSGGPPPATPPAATVPETPSAPVLRSTADPTSLELRTNGLIVEAENNLSRVRYADLSAQAKAQYDSAASFIKNARSALRVKNYMQAESLANKAAVLARELIKG